MAWLSWIVALVALAACGRGGDVLLPPATTVEHHITGTVTVRDDSTFFRPNDPCTGIGGYRDIAPNAQVTVKDQAGELLAVGNLGAGESVAVGETGSGIPLTHCRFEFGVGPLPDRPFYSVEVSRRGPVSYARADLEATAWHVELTLG